MNKNLSSNHPPTHPPTAATTTPVIRALNTAVRVIFSCRAAQGYKGAANGMTAKQLHKDRGRQHQQPAPPTTDLHSSHARLLSPLPLSYLPTGRFTAPFFAMPVRWHSFPAPANKATKHIADMTLLHAPSPCCVLSRHSATPPPLPIQPAPSYVRPESPEQLRFEAAEALVVAVHSAAALPAAAVGDERRCEFVRVRVRLVHLRNPVVVLSHEQLA